MKDVFISYVREEQEWAKWLAGSLKKKGLSIWLDKRELLCGREFAPEIERAIRNSRSVIVLWSGLSVTSEYVNKEASLGYDLKKLLPIIISDITEADLPDKFRGLHTLNLSKWQGADTHSDFRNLIRAIKEMPAAGLPQECARLLGRKTRSCLKQALEEPFEGDWLSTMISFGNQKSIRTRRQISQPTGWPTFYITALHLDGLCSYFHLN
jgi:hypothetical protein